MVQKQKLKLFPFCCDEVTHMAIKLRARQDNVTASKFFRDMVKSHITSNRKLYK